MPDTGLNEPIEMPPGFEELSPQDRMLIKAYRNDPMMLQTYNAIQITKLHNKQKDCRIECDTRIESLEDSRKKTKWWLGGAGAVILCLKAIIIAKWAKIFG